MELYLRNWYDKLLDELTYVKLTTTAVEWLEPRFQEALNRTGQIDEHFINSLPQTETEIALTIE